MGEPDIVLLGMLLIRAVVLRERKSIPEHVVERAAEYTEFGHHSAALPPVFPATALQVHA